MKTSGILLRHTRYVMKEILGIVCVQAYLKRVFFPAQKKVTLFFFGNFLKKALLKRHVTSGFNFRSFKQ